MRRIAVTNQKGGVGKTTTVANLGTALAKLGRRVLLIDLDPQAHLTLHLGVEPRQLRSSVYQVLTELHPIEQAKVALSESLHLVPSHINLAAAELELASVMGREVILRDQLLRHEGPYDFVLIDCPPSLGLLTVNALVAAEEVLIPLQPHFLGLQGLGKLLETLALAADRLNPALKVTGIILCMYESSTRLAAEVVADLQNFLAAAREQRVPWSQATLFTTRIRRNIKLAECPSHGQSIFDYEPRSAGAADYAALAAEILGTELDDEARALMGLPRAAGTSAPAARSSAPIAELPGAPAPTENHGDVSGPAEQQDPSDSAEPREGPGS